MVTSLSIYSLGTSQWVHSSDAGNISGGKSCLSWKVWRQGYCWAALCRGDWLGLWGRGWGEEVHCRGLGEQLHLPLLQESDWASLCQKQSQEENVTEKTNPVASWPGQERSWQKAQTWEDMLVLQLSRESVQVCWVQGGLVLWGGVPGGGLGGAWGVVCTEGEEEEGEAREKVIWKCLNFNQ